MQESRKNLKEREATSVMKTLVVGAIAFLLVAQLFGTADGGNKAQRKTPHEKWSPMKWALEGMAEGRQDGDPKLKYDDFYNCVSIYGATDDDMEEYFGNPTVENSTRLMQCIAGCYFEWAKLIVDRDLDKNRMETLLQVFGLDQVHAGDAASDCQANVAEVPRETCDLGAAVDECLRKLLAMATAADKRLDLKTKSISSLASQRKGKHSSKSGRK